MKCGFIVLFSIFILLVSRTTIFAQEEIQIELPKVDYTYNPLPQIISGVLFSYIWNQLPVLLYIFSEFYTWVFNKHINIYTKMFMWINRATIGSLFIFLVLFRYFNYFQNSISVLNARIVINSGDIFYGLMVLPLLVNTLSLVAIAKK